MRLKNNVFTYKFCKRDKYEYQKSLIMTTLRKLKSNIPSNKNSMRDIDISICTTDSNSDLTHLKRMLEHVINDNIICIHGLTRESYKIACDILHDHKSIDIFSSKHVLKISSCIFIKNDINRKIDISDDYYYKLKPNGYIIGADIVFNSVKLSVVTFVLSSIPNDSQLANIYEVIDGTDRDIVILSNLENDVFSSYHKKIHDIWVELGCCPELRNSKPMRILYTKNTEHVISPISLTIHNIPDYKIMSSKISLM